MVISSGHADVGTRLNRETIAEREHRLLGHFDSGTDFIAFNLNASHSIGARDAHSPLSHKKRGIAVTEIAVVYVREPTS